MRWLPFIIRTRSTIGWPKTLSVDIWAMFKDGFDKAEMVCIRENLFEDGEWAILQWRVLKSVTSASHKLQLFQCIMR
jgi:hypothetical protein